MSRRIRRSSEPNRYSADGLGELGLAGAGRAREQEHADRLAGIVQPGLEHGDAIDHALDGFVLADHAAGEERPGSTARSMRSLLSRIETGRPVNCDKVSSTSARRDLGSFLGLAGGELDQLDRRSREAWRRSRYWRAELTATSAHCGPIATPACSDIRRATVRASDNVSASDCASSRATANRPRSAGRICKRRAVLVGVASVQTTSRPATMAGRI